MPKAMAGVALGPSPPLPTVIFLLSLHLPHLPRDRPSHGPCRRPPRAHYCERRRIGGHTAPLPMVRLDRLATTSYRRCLPPPAPVAYSSASTLLPTPRGSTPSLLLNIGCHARSSSPKRRQRPHCLLMSCSASDGGSLWRQPYSAPTLIPSRAPTSVSPH
jgi:hypothetical protein